MINISISLPMNQF